MKPFEYLAHKYPFIMLDRAEVIEESRRAKGIKHITINDPVMLSCSVMPAPYIIEAMAQISGVASGRKESSMLAGLRDIIFLKNVHAGDLLELESILLRSFNGLYIFNCRASVTDKTIATGEIILHFNERE